MASSAVDLARTLPKEAQWTAQVPDPNMTAEQSSHLLELCDQAASERDYWRAQAKSWRQTAENEKAVRELVEKKARNALLMEEHTRKENNRLLRENRVHRAAIGKMNSELEKTYSDLTDTRNNLNRTRKELETAKMQLNMMMSDMSRANTILTPNDFSESAALAARRQAISNQRTLSGNFTSRLPDVQSMSPTNKDRPKSSPRADFATEF